MVLLIRLIPSVAMSIAATPKTQPNRFLHHLPTKGSLKDALHILHISDQPLKSCTYVHLLQACIQSRAIPDGKLIHAHINQTGFVGDRLLQNTLISMYVKCGSLLDARTVFNQMPERDVCSWTVMIAAYARHGPIEEALTLFHQMHPAGVQPNQFTFSGVVSACTKLASPEQGVKIHQQIITRGFQSHVSVANALVDMYANFGEIEKACELFNKMHRRSVVSWNVMIAGYAQNGFAEKAFALFTQMPERDAISWTTMIAGFAQKGLIDEASKLFKEMPEPNLVSWNAMIAGYARNGLFNEALKLFKEMPKRDVVSWTSMITGFAQNGLVDDALKFFKEMPEQDVVSWNAMIAGFAQNGHDKEALKLFHQMQVANIRPNSKTFASIVPVCASLVALEQGMKIHGKIIASGFQYDVFAMTALVDMYAKCGSIKMARKVFDKMHHRAIISWNAIIAGYAMNGPGKEALKLFEQMKHSDITPDHITFLSVLSACSHAGLVDEGYRFLNCMSENYHITPTMEHYVCMVDILGRAGHFSESQDFINKMPIKPDTVVWSCLLGACRIHNNTELGESVAKHLFELDPKDSAPYVFLSNIYAAAGRWSDIENLRKKMRDRGIKKNPGCSWIEVNKEVHAFTGGDRSHPKMQKV